MAISEQDIPWLQQIINVVLCNGASVWEIVNKLEDALKEAYCLQGYGASDLDIITLVFRLRGHQLLFALNQCLCLLSICCKDSMKTLTPKFSTLRDVSLMADEIALEEMAVHFSKYNKIAGICWKHSHLIDPVICTYKSAITIAQKIHNGKVHLGKELTVIGAVCFGEDELYPILAAPTCKTEDAADMEGVLVATGAAASVGPVRSFATDGDATCHAAGHKIFLKKPLSLESQLYSILSNMPGLNTMTGDAEVMLDFDFKHIFKCFCMLIHSPAGIVLNNTQLSTQFRFLIFNAMMLSRYLIWLPMYDEASVMKLLHPDDPQDVPWVIELMQAIVEFSKFQHSLLNNSFSTDINTHTYRLSFNHSPQQFD
ncbi:uncharacterized protein EDB93DRAFT_1238125 [Suillus bovinus]|uniref:uncharacterized protein n=1 Tax=Suillus bovinus TaxID=48563 RepID=UPI001B872DD6|nr:uncharacterized protein EDB93DRAFT_1238125 [Suillus bovinus]KAG2158373.1 hypothetical protein EDB93DRAFT_1238125 [Suillus bovinus]